MDEEPVLLHKFGFCSKQDEYFLVLLSDHFFLGISLLNLGSWKFNYFHQLVCHLTWKSISYLLILIGKQMETGANIVTGTRYIRNGGVHGRHLMRKLTSRAANVLAHTLHWPGVSDLTGSFRYFFLNLRWSFKPLRYFFFSSFHRFLRMWLTHALVEDMPFKWRWLLGLPGRDMKLKRYAS